jgi:hypothetical protein
MRGSAGCEAAALPAVRRLKKEQPLKGGPLIGSMWLDNARSREKKAGSVTRPDEVQVPAKRTP